MANPEATSDNQDNIKKDSDFLERRYTTIGVGTFIVLVIWCIFGVVSKPTPENLSWLVGIAVFLIIQCVAAFTLSAGYLGFAYWKKSITNEWRRKLLPWSAGFVIGTLGAMIWVSGGAINSSFSHFLGVICSLAIVLASKSKPRLIIGLVAFGVYVFTSFTSNALLHPYLPEPITLTPLKTILLHNFCFFISLVLALIAAPPEEKESASDKARTIGTSS